MIRFLIQSNYACIVMCVLMLVYLGIDRSFERKVRNLFGIAVWAVLALTLVDAVDLYNTKQDWNVIAGNCLNAIGMVLRPLPIFCIALIICRYRDKKYYGMILPFCINCLLALCIIPSGVCFIFSKENFFLYILLNYSPYLVCFFYMFVLVILTLLEYRQNGIPEMLTIFMIALITIVATVLESVFEFDFFLNVSFIISLMFYYLFLHVQIYKRDSLTNLLNRRSFYLDASDNLENPMTIAEIDLNNLKKINDSAGHSVGDKAILTVVDAMKTGIINGYSIYRTGGDEFMMLGIKKSRSESENIMKQIMEHLKDTPYQISYGIAEYDPGMSLEKVVKNADENMYQMKRETKQGRNDSEKKS